MMIYDSVWFWVVAVVFIIGLDVFSAIRAYRKHRIKGLKYDLKKSWNALTPLFNLILMAYFVVISLTPMQTIEDFAKKQSVGLLGLQYVVVRLIPSAYETFIIVIMLRIIIKGLIPSIKYNVEEKQWLKESDDKFSKKIKEWLHIKPKTENVEIK